MEHTCKWCGKRFDSSNSFSGGVKYHTDYCSKRCEIEAERERKLSESKEDTWLEKQWKTLPLKWKIIIIGAIAIYLYFYSSISGTP